MLAVITGASSGIGKELAYKLAEKRYDLILIARRIDRLEEIKSDLIKLNVNVEIFPLNLSDMTSLKAGIEYLQNKNIDLFINNAGFGIYGNSISQDDDYEINMIDLNIKALHYLTKAMIKSMEKGKIVNISSMAAFLPTPLLSSYAATKAYVYSYSMALRYELIKNNIPIKVITVCPGPVKTEFADVAKANPKMKGLSVEKCVKIILKGIEKNKALIIPGLKMKLLKFLIRFSPTWLLLKVSHQIQNKK